jgi:hypothetical protein
MLTADYNNANTHTPISNVELPDPATSLTATAIPEGIRFTVGLPSYLSANSVVELYMYTASTPFASATKLAELRADTFIYPVQDKTTRYFWVTIKNKATQAVSSAYPSGAGVAGSANLVTRTDIDPDEVTHVTVTTRSTDTFTAGAWASSSAAESTGVNATGQTGQSIEATITAQVEVTVFAAAQDLNAKLYWDSALNKVSGTQDNYFPITRAGKFTITVAATFASSTGTDGSIGAIYSVFDAPASVGNTIVVTDHHIRVTSVRR